jgi:hypothetical protein
VRCPHLGHCLLAGATLDRPSAFWPTFQSLALPGQPGVTFLGACCSSVSWPAARQVLDRGVMVVQSDLQAAFVEQQGQLLAWVTTTQGRSAPVAGARVQVYSNAYNAVSLGCSCMQRRAPRAQLACAVLRCRCRAQCGD